MERRKGQMKDTIAESLRRLMERNLFEKITIQQICEGAGVIRATFYNYFDDKFDCLNYIVYKDITEEYMESFTRDDFNSGIQHCLEHVQEHREFYRVAYTVTGQNSFENMIRENLRICLLG